MGTEVRTETRTTDRTAATEVPTGVATATGTGVTHRPRPGAPLALPLGITVQKISDIFKPVIDALNTANEALSNGNGIPAEFWHKVVVHAAKPETADFLVTMSTVVTDFKPLMTGIDADPQIMSDGANMANLIGQFQITLDKTNTVLKNIQAIALAVGMRDGRVVYKRAAGVAPTHPEMAGVIARFRNMFVRIGKKAAETRKSRAKAKAHVPATAAAAPAEATGVTTVITTK